MLARDNQADRVNEAGFCQSFFCIRDADIGKDIVASRRYRQTIRGPLDARTPGQLRGAL